MFKTNAAKNRIKWLTSSAFGVSLALASGQSLAQQAAPSANGAATGSDTDIVVTARRKAETQQSVPVAITAFTTKALQAQAIYSANDLNKAVPGMSVVASQSNPGIPAFAIRGRGLNYGAAAGGVETYFADVPLSGPFQAQQLPPQFFDLQSMQVLKGPQGTLFGRSTTGGAVLVVPQAPTDRFEGSFRLQGGNFGNFQAEGVINVPIVADKAMLRIAAFDWQRKGYSHTFPGTIETLTGEVLPSQRFNNVDETEVRATLLLKPLDGVENSTIVTYHTDDTRGSAGAGLFIAGFDNNGAPIIQPSRGYGTQWSESDVRFRQKRSQVIALINTTTINVSDAVTFKNIFGYIDSKGDTAQTTNTDGSAFTTVSLPGVPRLTRNKQLTDEIQLQGKAFDDSLSWTIGALADQSRQPGGPDKINIQSIVYYPDYPTLPCFAIEAAPGFSGVCNNAITKFAQNRLTSKGVYGSFSYKPTSDLTINAGYRHSWDNVALTAGVAAAGVVQSPTAQLPSVAQALFPTLHKKFQGDTYNVDVDYNLTRSTMLYAGYRRGYKRGGFNQSFPANAPNVAAFAPETVDDFSAGIKSDFHIVGMPARFNIEAFYDIYKGQQVSYYGLTDDGLSSITTNVDKSTYKGIDLQFGLEPTSWLALNGSYSLIKAKNNRWTDTSLGVVNGEPVSTLDLSINPVMYVSKNKLTATARFHQEVGSLGEFVFAPTISYQSGFYSYPNAILLPAFSQLTFGNFNGLALGSMYVPGYTLADLRVEWNHISGSNFSAAINVTNLTNKTYMIGNGATLFYGVEGNAYGAPRMFSFDLSFNF